MLCRIYSLKTIFYASPHLTLMLRSGGPNHETELSPVTRVPEPRETTVAISLLKGVDILLIYCAEVTEAYVQICSLPVLLCLCHVYST